MTIKLSSKFTMMLLFMLWARACVHVCEVLFYKFFLDEFR